MLEREQRLETPGHDVGVLLPDRTQISRPLTCLQAADDQTRDTPFTMTASPPSLASLFARIDELAASKQEVAPLTGEGPRRAWRISVPRQPRMRLTTQP